MTASVLDGAAIAQSVFTDLQKRVAALRSTGIRPGLATVVVGDNPASRVYVRNKMRACAEVGLHAEVHELSADCSEDELMAKVAALNAAREIHGIIVQLPLPRAIDAQRVLQSIALGKDVDGFNWNNLGAIVDGHPQLVPCTPLGVMQMLDYAGVELEGRHAVVVGRSSIVGKPVALLLIARGATVTVCNSKTPDLAAYTRTADVLVVAAGRAKLVTADMVKAGATVIDVGINRLPDGKLVGDVDYAAVKSKAGAISPVPGGVGRMTVAMLVANTVLAAERQQKPASSTASSRSGTATRD
ncbi:MAG TPA: tetrahydrofolate dehydrogenase/cyclohydrolase catalytic domain-containing protein [Burkholderiales bacterium]|jgi:methylenetetrahydrofolate dehydrogenase (NADP+)/methenyltetrahydrofolate cyclohydrolase|nr:tetrahydrofolate dehydrogenase/cyclohydrolase catalytic domain-containing protein [Burkholderiales bacterium]